MRSASLKLFLISVLALMSCYGTIALGQVPVLEPASKLLIDRCGEFKGAGAASPLKPDAIPGMSNDFKITSAASRDYLSKDGRRFGLTLVSTESDSAAYALLTNARAATDLSLPGQGFVTPDGIGTDGFVMPKRLFFARGPALIVVDGADEKSSGFAPLVELAKAFSTTIDRGEGDIPVLVKHLPDWKNYENSILYAVTTNTLLKAFSNQPVLQAIRFDGGAEAVVCTYGGPRMAIVEFHTPQIAGDNHGRITAKIQELSSQGQPVPSAYRRVGNYSVFVFDAPSQEAANQLIDKVQYQQMVQWLGRNPYLYERATREFTQTTLGVFIAVVKASGLAIIGSLAFGGLLGALLFRQRRASRRSMDQYSDAGGMVRLNLDEVTARPDPARLLGPGTR